MSIAEAIVVLRERMGAKQNELAERLGVTVTSISRYENGRKPNRQVLKKLADIAESARLNDLRDVFAARWKAGIIARLRRLPSPGTERGVPLEDLRRWHDMAALVKREVSNARKSYIAIANSKPEDQAQLAATHRILHAIETNVAGELTKLIEPYINAPNQKGRPHEKTKR